MKIIEFRQENICYLSKNKNLKIERDDIWGNPKENKESLLAYYQKAAESRDDIVHVLYLYGQGGIGKSFVCTQLAEKLHDLTAGEKKYVVVLDLQQQNEFEDQLKCLADEIMAQMKKKELFPQFYMAYYSYKMKRGEQAQEEERTTQWDKLQENSSYSLVSGAASLLTSFGSVSDVIDVANEGYKWFLNMRNQMKYKAAARQIENMDVKELKEQLVQYFAADFIKLAGNHQFIFLLDTVESMRYHALRAGAEDDYLDWLSGKNGLFRVLPGCFWILFGREEISWDQYDPEWEQSFLSQELKKPDEKAIRKYLEQQLRGGLASDTDEHELEQVVDVIVERTECYPLAVHNCVDMYFRIWNNQLRKNVVTDEKKIKDYRPCAEAIGDIILDHKGKKVISNRFMQYYTLQEREVLYTLVCLGTWTDEVLEKILWTGSMNNRFIYEEMCDTSFIKAGRDGRKSIQGLMLDTMTEECPGSMKKQILQSVLRLMQTEEISDKYRMLYQSAIHIAKYYCCEGFEREMLGQEFIRLTNDLKEHANITELEKVCEDLWNTENEDDADDDLTLSAHIGWYYAQIYQKEQNSERFKEEFVRLSSQKNFGRFSYQMWKNMDHMARIVGAYKEVYDITELLWKNVEESGNLEIGDMYFLRRSLVEDMEQLPEIFSMEQIRTEIEELCDIHENLNLDRREIQRLNAIIWSCYYVNAAKTVSEEQADEYSDKIGEWIQKYRSCCTKREAEMDLDLCRMEIMQVKAQKSWDVGEIAMSAMRGLRILYEMYGDRAWQTLAGAEFVQYLMLIPEDLEQQDHRMLESIFVAYYRDFCRSITLENYKVLQHLYFWSSHSAWVAKNDGEVFDLDLSASISQGIIRLNNRKHLEAENELALLISYEWYSGRGSSEQKELSEEWQLYRIWANQLLLMKLLWKETEVFSARLSVFLRYIFGGKQEWKQDEWKQTERQLLGILNGCGIETETSAWKAEYLGENRGDAFSLFEYVKGWIWGIDIQADAWMADTVLYLAHTVDDETDQLEMKLLKALKSEMSSYKNHTKYHTKEQFELCMTEAAKCMGEECYAYISSRMSQSGEDETPEADYEKQIIDLLAENDYDRARDIMKQVLDEDGVNDRKIITLFYVDIVRDRGFEHYMEHLAERYEKSKDKCYVILRGYAYLKEWENFVQYYWKEWDGIWQVLGRAFGFWSSAEELYRMLSNVKEAAEAVGDDEIVEDFMRKMCDVFASGNSFSGYTEGVLTRLPEIIEVLSFEELWNKEQCIREISIDNYKEIYKNLCPYLDKNELLEIFTQKIILKNATDFIPFFNSEYYAWLKDKFQDSVEEKLQTEYPEACRVRDEYENGIGPKYMEELQDVCRKIVKAANRQK